MYAPPVYLSGHRDGPLSRRARIGWWLAGAAIVVAGVALIVVSAR